MYVSMYVCMEQSDNMIEGGGWARNVPFFGGGGIKRAPPGDIL